MLKLPIYMDNHATTPLDPRVLEAMKPYLGEDFGNAASRNHVFGWRAEAAVELARKQVAALIGASDKEIVFTSGATESNNLAIKGVAEFYKSKGDHIITLKTEHKAVLDTCKRLERMRAERLEELKYLRLSTLAGKDFVIEDLDAFAKQRGLESDDRFVQWRATLKPGQQVTYLDLIADAATLESIRQEVTTKLELKYELEKDPVFARWLAQTPLPGARVTYLDVERDGRVNLDALRAAITDRTILVSVMLANNEIGVLQPVNEIGKICREKGVLFHCDAVQGVGKVPFHVDEAKVDLVSLSAHKLYGPKGVGALYVRRKPRVRLAPLIDGGGHERGMRSGTLNVAAIVGFGKAAEIARTEMASEAERLLTLRERLRKGLSERLDMLTLNGSLEHRLPGNLNISFAFVEGEALMMAIKDVAVSSGSACTSASLEPSYVLRACGVEEDLAHSSIRFGLGRFNTQEEVDYVIQLVAEKVTKLREMSPLYEMAKEGIDLKSVQWTAH